MVIATDSGKKIIRIGFDDVETWPDWCVRESKDCRQCSLQGKIACHPRFRVGLIKPSALSQRDIVKALLKSGERPFQVHQRTNVPLPTIYSIGQQLRNKGELARLLEPLPQGQKDAILDYVRAHPDEQYKDIATQFKVERSNISRLCNKAGIHRRAYLSKKRDEVISEAIRILENEPGRSIANVAEQLGLGPTTLGHYLKQKGKLAINHEARVFLEAVRQQVIAAVLEAFAMLRNERVIIVDRTTERKSN